MKRTLVTLLRENRGLLLFLVLMLFFRSSLADWNVVPTSSMQPTIVEGDRILINKMAYDFRLPFTDIAVATYADPRRGDIVIFESKVANKRLVKRVIGLPGDEVAMHNNRVWINGVQLSYQMIASSNANAYASGKGERATQSEQFSHDTQKTSVSLSHRIVTSSTQSSRASFSAVVVPQGQYLVLGDNRDNSADSRVIGFVPREEIIGRSQTVVMSLDPQRYYLPRSERFWKSL